MRQWTAEQRQAQRELIQRVQPWRKSTGARTPKGKARSSQNALKHGFRSREQIESRRQISKLIRQCKEIIRTHL